MFDHRDIVIPKNLQQKTRSYFLRLPVITYIPKSDKRRQSYERRNTAHMQKGFSNSNTCNTFS
jgi:hypothetical protein